MGGLVGFWFFVSFGGEEGTLGRDWEGGVWSVIMGKWSWRLGGYGVLLWLYVLIRSRYNCY